MLANLSQAASVPAADQTKLKQTFSANFPQIKVESVRLSPVPNLYELVLENGESVFSDKTGEHLLVNAKLLEVNGPGQVVDVLETRKSADRKARLAKLDTQDAVVFKGKGATTTPLYVFTDVDCGYCRKFHEEVPELQAAGIDVVYFAWPRAGVTSPAGEVMSKIWCAKDQQAAMTKAKGGSRDATAQESDCTAPIAEQVQLGLKMGVAGTPAVFTTDGTQVGGYVPAKDLIKMLKASQAASKPAS